MQSAAVTETLKLCVNPYMGTSNKLICHLKGDLRQPYILCAQKQERIWYPGQILQRISLLLAGEVATIRLPLFF